MDDGNDAIKCSKLQVKEWVIEVVSPDTVKLPVINMSTEQQTVHDLLNSDAFM